MGSIDWIKNIKKLDQIKKMCLKKYQDGYMNVLDAAMRMLYNQNPKNAVAVFTYIAKNSPCNDDSPTSPSQQLLNLWNALDSASCMKYRNSVIAEYKKTVSTFKAAPFVAYKNSFIKNFNSLNVNQQLALSSPDDIPSLVDFAVQAVNDLRSSDEGPVLNVNDGVSNAVFLDSFIRSTLRPLLHCAEMLYVNFAGSPAIKKSNAAKLVSITSTLKSSLGITLNIKVGADNLSPQITKTATTHTLSSIVSKSNNISKLLVFKF